MISIVCYGGHAVTKTIRDLIENNIVNVENTARKGVHATIIACDLNDFEDL